MGSGKWTSTNYVATTEAKLKSGTTFAYSRSVASVPFSERKAHDSLNIKDVPMRECCISTEHPSPTPIVVGLDVTGSMQAVPKHLQTRLTTLLGILERGSYCTSPQILFGAIGDAFCDAVPIQVGQFESDNRLDDNLDNLYLEGGGGGQKTESYELFLYYMARHTRLESLEKQNRKGYLFITGDEMPYPVVSKHQVEKFIGNDGLEADIPLETIIAEAKEKYNVYFLVPNMTSHYADAELEATWTKLLDPGHFIKVQDAGLIPEIIASIIGATEGVDISSMSEVLVSSGTDIATVEKVTSTVAHIAKSGPIAKMEGSIPEVSSHPSEAQRI